MLAISAFAYSPAATVDVDVFGEAACPDTRDFVLGPLARLADALGTTASVRYTSFGNAYFFAPCAGAVVAPPGCDSSASCRFNATTRDCWFSRCGLGAARPPDACFKGSPRCQHGAAECLANRVTLCAGTSLPFVSCYFRALGSEWAAGSPSTAVLAVGRRCAVALGVRWDEVSACIDGARGGELVERAARRTPPHPGVPYALVGGRPASTTNATLLLQAACRALPRPRPAACAAESPQPGSAAALSPEPGSAAAPAAQHGSEAAPATQPRAPARCAFASVGAGWAGIYSAWRVAVDAKARDPTTVCVFEGSPRFGGRTFTVRGDAALFGLNIDIGAYRFAFEQHLPADLLRGPLRLPTACYIPSCEREPLDGNLTLHKLMDPRLNSSAGYGTALDVMVAELRAAGAHLQLHKELDAVHAHPRPTGAVLRWKDGGSTVADSVLLNLPRHALNRLSRDSLLFTDGRPLARALYNCSRETSQANYSAEASVKVYLVYEDAWWRTRLGLVQGEVHAPSDPPMYIRYHDGPVRCGEGAAPACAGALLVQYAHSLEAGGGFYMPFRASKSTPLTVLRGEASELPGLLHRKLLQMHAARLADAGIDPRSLAEPAAVVLGFWPHARDEILHPAPDPLSFSTAHGALPQCLHGVTSASYSEATRQPVVGRSLSVANNDWWLEESSVDLIAPYWAEVSLRVAERVLHDQLGLARPAWLNAAYYRKSVLGI